MNNIGRIAHTRTVSYALEQHRAGVKVFTKTDAEPSDRREMILALPCQGAIAGRDYTRLMGQDPAKASQLTIQYHTPTPNNLNDMGEGPVAQLKGTTGWFYNAFHYAWSVARTVEGNLFATKFTIKKYLKHLGLNSKKDYLKFYGSQEYFGKPIKKYKKEFIAARYQEIRKQAEIRLKNIDLNRNGELEIPEIALKTLIDDYPRFLQPYFPEFFEAKDNFKLDGQITSEERAMHRRILASPDQDRYQQAVLEIADELGILYVKDQSNISKYSIWKRFLENNGLRAPYKEFVEEHFWDEFANSEDTVEKKRHKPQVDTSLESLHLSLGQKEVTTQQWAKFKRTDEWKQFRKSLKLWREDIIGNKNMTKKNKKLRLAELPNQPALNYSSPQSFPIPKQQERKSIPVTNAMRARWET